MIAMRAVFYDLVVFLYASGGFISLAAYLPQIYTYLSDKESRKSISLPSWIAWTFVSVATMLYALLIVHDALFFLISATNLVMQSIVVVVKLFHT